MARPLDTTTDAWRRQQAIYRDMSGAQRVAIALQMSEDARQIALAGIRARHPAYSDAAARRALFRLIYGDDLCREVWPGEPLLDP